VRKQLTLEVIIQEVDDNGSMAWAVNLAEDKPILFDGSLLAYGHAKLHIGAVRMIAEQLEGIVADTFIPQ
jgi:hypothetical protein